MAGSVFSKSRFKISWLWLVGLGFIGLYDVFSGIQTRDIRSVLKGAATVLLGVYLSTSPAQEPSTQRLKTARLVVISASAVLFLSSVLA